ncbi:hypothetical protein Tco_0796407 [Tanacetum coccineum]
MDRPFATNVGRCGTGEELSRVSHRDDEKEKLPQELSLHKKRIEKLQHDGLLNSIDIESLGKCVSCLSGKMARKPYSHQVEREQVIIGPIVFPDMPQTLSVREENRTTADMVRTMNDSNYSSNSPFGIMALETAVRILNHAHLKNKVLCARMLGSLSLKKLWDLKASGSVEDLEEIPRRRYKSLLYNTSLNHKRMNQEIDKPSK